MRRLTTALTAGLLVLAGVVVLGAQPAHANANITARSVALAEDTACDDASLDLDFLAVDADWESGLSTNLAGDTLGEFSQVQDWDGWDDLFTGWGLDVSPTQTEGTIIGAYAQIGQEVPTAENSAEFFILYACGDPGANTVIYTCVGDYGTCPQTAAEGAGAAFAASVDNANPAPGATVTVTGEGCVYPLAGAVLLQDGTGVGSGDTVAPNLDGTFEITLTVPADLPAGTALTAQVDCGFDGDTVLSLDIALTVGTAPTTTTTAAPPAAAVAPRFTG